MAYTLKMFNTGQITLPKTWRSRYDTQHFLAEETEEGLLIIPITAKQIATVHYENKEEFGVYFPEGINPEVLISQIKPYQNDK